MDNKKKEQPSDFDWVTARAQCSALTMFELLKADVQKNVETMKAIVAARGQESSYRFHASGELLSVTRFWYGEEIGVKVSLYGEQFEVGSKGVGADGFSATLTLDDSGECRFLVDGERLDRWQFLRRAFEPLFFPTERGK